MNGICTLFYIIVCLGATPEANTELQSLKYLSSLGVTLEFEGDFYIDDEQWQTWEHLPQKGGEISHVSGIIIVDRIIDSTLVNHLKNFQHLQSMCLFNCEIKESSGFNLENWSYLSEFLFWNSEKKSPQVLFQSFRLCSIQRLEIVGQFTEEDLKNIAKIPNLYSLRITISEAEKIQFLIPLQEKLKYLDITSVNVTHALIPILKEFSHLHTLCIKSARMEVDFIKGLKIIPIHRLMLYSPQITDAWLSHIAELNTIKIISIPVETGDYPYPPGLTKEGLNVLKNSTTQKIYTNDEGYGWN